MASTLTGGSIIFRVTGRFRVRDTVRNRVRVRVRVSDTFGVRVRVRGRVRVRVRDTV